jgi:hypothetical protein
MGRDPRELFNSTALVIQTIKCRINFLGNTNFIQLPIWLLWIENFIQTGTQIGVYAFFSDKIKLRDPLIGLIQYKLNKTDVHLLNSHYGAEVSGCQSGAPMQLFTGFYNDYQRRVRDSNLLQFLFLYSGC